MILLLGITALFGAISADIGIGYRYKVPHTSYGVPAYQISSTSGGYNTGQASGSGGGGFGYKEQPNVQPSSFGQQGPNVLSEFQYTASGVNPGYQVLGGGAQGSQQYFNQYQTSNQYQQSAVQKYNEYYNQVQQQPPQVFKHFYVHTAPEEPELSKPRQPLILPPPQKHYKIIFIKAPTQAPGPPQVIPVQQQNEEKTIVYVLVKNPDDAQNVVIPKVEHKPPTKPEVYFIKYNTKEGPQAAINNIVNDYSKGQESVSFSGVNALGASNSFSGTSDVSGTPAFGLDSISSSESQTTGDAQSDSFSSGSLSLQSAEVSDGPSNVNSLNAASFDTGSVSSSFDFSQNTGSSSSSSGNSELTANDNINTITTSQGVPHETYGPPQFRT